MPVKVPSSRGNLLTPDIPFTVLLQLGEHSLPIISFYIS